MSGLHHIQEKTARNIHDKLTVRDTYTRNIKMAAAMLVKRYCGFYVYQTQWNSGATLWSNPKNKDGMFSHAIIGADGTFQGKGKEMVYG